MNKDMFLMQLEQLLSKIPREEREEAMDYYRSYFEDAGMENEAAVLEELESPQVIADSIKEALSSTGDMTGALKNPPQVREGQFQSGRYEYGKKTQDGPQNTGNTFSGSDFEKEGTRGPDYQKASRQACYRRYDQYENRSGRHLAGGMDRRTKLILFVIAAVILLPVWGTVFSVVAGAAGALLAAVILLGICSVGGVIGGVACTVVAIVKMCTLSIAPGLILLGIGMLLIAGSGICTVLLLLVFGRLVPWAFRQITQLFQRLLQQGRSAA
ncbi:MAG: DUF1700 domain-containing protein [Eubacterium sp.]|jgi:hypothetical protein|nr:DUF1700 domain-containing protein [Eubacterium sp.]